MRSPDYVCCFIDPLPEKWLIKDNNSNTVFLKKKRAFWSVPEEEHWSKMPFLSSASQEDSILPFKGFVIDKQTILQLQNHCNTTYSATDIQTNLASPASHTVVIQQS